MISCTEFIWTYNELFKFLEARHGKEEVYELWRGISKDFLWNLEKYVREEGTWGMRRYWGHTLPDEGAVFNMIVTDDVFIIDMYRCPSANLVHTGPAEPYPDYCEHCVVLYPPLIERLGFECRADVIDCKAGTCRFTVKRKGAPWPDSLINHQGYLPEGERDEDS